VIVTVPEKAFDWLAFWIALAGIISNAAQAIWNNRIQAKLKRYEVTFLEKRKSYVGLMRLLSDQAELGANKPHYSEIEFRGRFGKVTHDLAEVSHSLEPFLDSDGRAWLRRTVGEAGARVNEIMTLATQGFNTSANDRVTPKLVEFNAWGANAVAPYLFPRLFEGEPR